MAGSAKPANVVLGAAALFNEYVSRVSSGLESCLSGRKQIIAFLILSHPLEYILPGYRATRFPSRLAAGRGKDVHERPRPLHISPPNLYTRLACPFFLLPGGWNCLYRLESIPFWRLSISPMGLSFHLSFSSCLAPPTTPRLYTPTTRPVPESLTLFPRARFISFGLFACLLDLSSVPVLFRLLKGIAFFLVPELGFSAFADVSPPTILRNAS